MIDLQEVVTETEPVPWMKQTCLLVRVSVSDSHSTGLFKRDLSADASHAAIFWEAASLISTRAYVV